MSNVWSNDDIVPICSECKSQQTERYMDRNPFAQEGKPTPCQYCGGIVVVMYRKDKQDALNAMNQERNIGHDPDKKQQ